MLSLSASAQSADKLYDEGKQLFDAEQYDKGYGVKENDKKAFELYQKAARQDYAKAMYQLGKCYLKGKGVTANADEARKWIKRAVNDPKNGPDILKDLRKAKADGEEAAKILTLIGK